LRGKEKETNHKNDQAKHTHVVAPCGSSDRNASIISHKIKLTKKLIDGTDAV
jgi:hypothetical protein